MPVPATKPTGKPGTKLLLANYRSAMQSSAHPHTLTPKRVAQIEKWRLLGAQARRGHHVAQRAEYSRKRAKRGRKGVASTLAKSTAWGIQKMVVPVGIGGPIVALAKNRLPGYNQFQIAKASGHAAGSAKRKGLKRK